MAIKGVYIGDVLDTSHLLLPGEEKQVHILTGINALGRTTERDGSVAWQIAKWPVPGFNALESGVIGDVRSKTADIVGGRKLSAHGIMCNIPVQGGHDWDFAATGIAEGLKTLVYALRNATDPHELAVTRNRLVEIARSYAESGGTDVWRKELTSQLAQLEAQELPNVRSVLIGTGPNGARNHANWHDILHAMIEARLNIHLFLREPRDVAHLVQVRQQYPKLDDCAPLRSPILVANDTRYREVA